MATRDEKKAIAEKIQESKKRLNQGGLALTERLKEHARIETLEEIQLLWN